MSKSLEELRIQRTLIQKHLDWIDAQIEKTESTTGDHKLKITENAPEVSVTTDEAQAPSGSKQFESEPTIPSDNEIEHIFAGSTHVSDVKNAQIGCFILFATATLLFLFLLFGLPYLLD